MMVRRRAASLVLLACLAGASGAVLQAEAVPSYTLQNVVDHRPSPLDAGIPGFDSAGTAYLRSGTMLSIVRRDGGTAQLDLDAIARATIDRDIFKRPGAWDRSWDKGFMVDNAVVLDSAGRLYTLIIPRYSNLRNAVLLWSPDRGRNWRALQLEGRNAALEHPDAFNDHDGPPTVLGFDTYGGKTGTRAWLNPLAIKAGEVAPAVPPLLLTNRSLLVGNHSGAANSTFTTRSKIYVVYDTTDTAGAGTLSVARQFDRASGRLESGEIPIGRSMTAATADTHDIPAITMDPDHRLTVVIGAHHAPFRYFTSKRAGTLLDGFVDNGTIGQPKDKRGYGSYSYVGMLSSRNGTINIVARSEGDRALYQLVQLRKPWRRPWTVWPSGLLHRVLAEPTRPHYGAWRQRLSMDRQGRLFLNFRYYANDLYPSEASALGLAGGRTKDCAKGHCWYVDAPERMPATLTSTDDGKTWH